TAMQVVWMLTVKPLATIATTQTPIATPETSKSAMIKMSMKTAIRKRLGSAMPTAMEQSTALAATRTAKRKSAGTTAMIRISQCVHCSLNSATSSTTIATGTSMNKPLTSPGIQTTTATDSASTAET